MDFNDGLISNSGLRFDSNNNDPDDILNLNDFDYSFGGLANNNSNNNINDNSSSYNNNHNNNHSNNNNNNNKKQHKEYPDFVPQQNNLGIRSDNDTFSVDQWNQDQQNDNSNNIVGSFLAPANNKSAPNPRNSEHKKSNHGYSNSEVSSINSRHSHSPRPMSFSQRSRDDMGQSNGHNNGHGNGSTSRKSLNGPPFENEGYRYGTSNQNQQHGHYFGREDGQHNNNNTSYPNSPYSSVSGQSEHSDTYQYQEHQSVQSPYMAGRQHTPQHNYRSGGNSRQQQNVNTSNILASNRNSGSYHHGIGTGGSNAQGRAINKMLLEILRERVVDPQRLDLVIDTHTERMDCVNLATLLFHTGKKRLILSPPCIKRIAARMNLLKEELRSREASNALYGLKCMCSEVPEVRQLVLALAYKVASSSSEFVAQAVGNALYGCQMMTSDHEEVRYLLLVLSTKVTNCTEPLEAQNIGNALYGLRGMNSDHMEVRAIVSALTPKIATAREELNGQALGNSLYGLQSMSVREPEVRYLLAVLATKVTHTWEELKAQEVGNALYGLKRMSTDVPEVRILISALIAKISTSTEILDAQAIGNSFYGMQNMQTDNSTEVLALLGVLAEKVVTSCPELDGQAMGNSLYGLQGMRSQHQEVRSVVSALTDKLLSSCLDLNAQEMGNALYGLQHMDSGCLEVRRLVAALTEKVSSSQHELTSQEIGNAMFGLQGMSTTVAETRILVRQIAEKTMQSHAILDPQGVSNSLLGIQRMSSDSQDVRLMVKALSTKIEHSWKLLSAQHVSNSLYGMQCMSSADTEVHNLLRALQPKIISCRDEMTVKQLSFSLFGLRYCSSAHENVRLVLLALKEKFSASVLPPTASGVSGGFWTMHSICMALFGMQGVSSEVEEVTQLLSVLVSRLSISSDLVPFLNEARSQDGWEAEAKLPEVDGEQLSNALFGMQRMSTSNKEVLQLLNMISALFGQVSNLSTKACANILFGVHKCSCACESTRVILAVVSVSVQVVISEARRLSGAMTTDHFDDLSMLFQAMTLCLWFIPEKESMEESLRQQFDNQLSTLGSLVDQHSAQLYIPRQQTVLEHRLWIELSDRLRSEPFKLQTGLRLHGFHVSTFVSFDPAVVPLEGLHTAGGDLFHPRLIIEVRGSSFNCPAKALFHDLQKQYLTEAHGFTVETLYADMCETELLTGNNFLGQCGLRWHPNLLNCLHVPSLEDVEPFTSQLNTHGKLTTSSPGLFLSSAKTISLLNHDTRQHEDDVMYNDNAARSFQYQHFALFGSRPDKQMESSVLGREFFDDDFSSVLVPYRPFAGRELEEVTIQKPVASRHRAVMGMGMTWVGAWPTLALNAAPQLVWSVSRQFLTSLNEKAKVQQQHGGSSTYYGKSSLSPHHPPEKPSNASSPTLGRKPYPMLSIAPGPPGGAQYGDPTHATDNLHDCSPHPHHAPSNEDTTGGMLFNSVLDNKDHRRPLSLAMGLSDSLSMGGMASAGNVPNIQQAGGSSPFALSPYCESSSANSSNRAQWMGNKEFFLVADGDADHSTRTTHFERQGTAFLKSGDRPATTTHLQQQFKNRQLSRTQSSKLYDSKPYESQSQLNRTFSSSVYDSRSYDQGSMSSAFDSIEGFGSNTFNRTDGRNFNDFAPPPSLALPLSASLSGNASSAGSTELDSLDPPSVSKQFNSNGVPSPYGTSNGLYSASNVAPPTMAASPLAPPGLGTGLVIVSPPSPASSISSSSSVPVPFTERASLDGMGGLGLDGQGRAISLLQGQGQGVASAGAGSVFKDTNKDSVVSGGSLQAPAAAFSSSHAIGSDGGSEDSNVTSCGTVGSIEGVEMGDTAARRGEAEEEEDVDEEIEALEAQLEIARLEAKIKALKNKKASRQDLRE